MLFDPSEYDVKPLDKNKGVDNMDNKNFFVVGVAGKGEGSKIPNPRVLAGIIENRKNPIPELVDIVGIDDMEPIDYEIHQAHGVHVRVTSNVNEDYMGVYQIENGYCILDMKNGIITNEYYKDNGVPKHVLFKSWIKELGSKKAILLYHNYPVKRVLAMSEEEAESETQALGYGI